jgi:hypothetical protein
MRNGRHRALTKRGFRKKIISVVAICKNPLIINKPVVGTATGIFFSKVSMGIIFKKLPIRRKNAGR